MIQDSTVMDERTPFTTPEPDVDLEPLSQEGVWGMTRREAAIASSWLLALVVSLFPIAGTALGGGVSVWAMDGQWVLSIGVPSLAVFLLLLRRYSPQGIRRVGSLGIDQFASVSFSVAAVSWSVLLWQQTHLAAVTGSSPLGSWVVWVETALFLVLVVLTVFASLVPGIRDDFLDRPSSLAHRNANPVRPVALRPLRTKKTSSMRVLPRGEQQHHDDEITDDSLPDPASLPLSAWTHAAGGAPGTEAVGSDDAPPPRYSRRRASGAEEVEVSFEDERAEGEDTLTAIFGDALREEADEEERGRAEAGQRDGDTDAGGVQPFWALTARKRQAHDESGDPVFDIGPDEWVLVLEDRGGAYVVRHEDGRVGYLHETDDMTRG